MSTPPELPDLPDPEELRDRLSRLVAVATVVTTLMAALVGYLLASASRGDDLEDVTAQRLAARAAGRLLRAQQRSQAQYQTFVLAEEQRRKAAAATQEQLFVRGVEGRRQKLEETRWTKLAERTQALTPITETGPDGPSDDPAFPLRFYARSQREPVRLAALQDAANAVSSIWEAKVARYTAVLTLFAVALYLFGLSFAMQLRVRKLFAVTGSILLVAGTAWAALEALRSARRPPPEAAEAFAAGHVALLTASSPEEYRAAAEHHARAIELRPDFARAYVQRSEATFRGGSPQRSGYTSITSPEALESSIADLRRALELGADTLTVRASLGFYTFVDGVREGRPEALDESIGFTEAALELDADDPVLHFNLGVAHLAAGRVDEARAAYERGVRHMLYTDVAKEELRGNPQLEQEWVAGALTDLDLLLQHGEAGLAGDVRAMKEYVVGSASRGELGSGETAVTAGEPSIDLFPSDLQWRATLEGYDEETDVVSTQWYHRAGLEWAILPEASGLVTPGFDEVLGEHFGLHSYLTTTLPPRCLPEGEYRAEIYVNGRLVTTGEGEAAFGGLEAAVDRDLEVGMCTPADWEPTEVGLPGLLGGYVAPDETRGVYILRITLPSQLDELSAEDRTRGFLQALPGQFPDLFPAPPAFDEEEDTRFFTGLEGPLRFRYSYEGGSVLAGGGIDEDGAVLIGAVFAPVEEFDGQAPYQVFDSIVRLG